jgi:hypothetical protein
VLTQRIEVWGGAWKSVSVGNGASAAGGGGGCWPCPGIAGEDELMVVGSVINGVAYFLRVPVRGVIRAIQG